MFNLTEEQEGILQLVRSKQHPFIKIEAVAGSGKSSTLDVIARELNTKGEYLAFNKDIVQEATQLFKGTNTNVVTTNAKAYKYVITKGLVDNGTAREKFIKLVKEYIPTFTLDKKYTQKYLSFNVKKIVPIKNTKALKYIEAEFDKFIKQKRELDVGFGFSSIREKLSSEDKRLLLSLLEEFCNSKYLSLKDFLNKKDELRFLNIISKYLTKMANKEMKVPFVFNLKYYHILLSKGLVPDENLGLLMLDEFSDSSEVVLEIFNLIPAKQKVVAGDVHQSINSFAYCVNGFRYFSMKGTTRTLSTSFRLPVNIAKDIEKFGQEHLDCEFVFKGFDKPYPENPTTAYLCRTNAGLIKQMSELQKKGIQYKLNRSVKLIFGLIKTLIYISPKNPIYNSKYKYLEADIKQWNSYSSIRTQYKTLLNYIKMQHDDNVEIQSAISIIMSQGRKEILDTLDRALAIEKRVKKAVFSISTVHACKGRGYTEVYLNDDLDISKILEIPNDERTLEEQEQVNLFYVACSRATHNLYNAKCLKV